MSQQSLFSQTVSRLSQASVRRRSNSHAEVLADQGALDPTHPGLRLPEGDPLAQSMWYQSLPPEQQSRIGFLRLAVSLKTAWQFENILQQGLLHRALYLSEGTEEFRYIHYEVIEESQHTLMFDELIRRWSGSSRSSRSSGLSPTLRGMPSWLRHVAAQLMRILGRHSPVVFFSMVLAGEEPLDLMQRQWLGTDDLPPIVQQVLQIHVAEEARHISYARAAIRDEAARLSSLRRRTVAFFTPVALGIMVRLMVRPTHDLLAGGIPRDVLSEVYRSPAGRDQMIDGVGRIRALLAELGLVDRTARLMWRAMGI